MTFFENLFGKKESKTVGLEQKKIDQAQQALAAGQKKRAKNLDKLSKIAAKHPELVDTQKSIQWPVKR